MSGTGNDQFSPSISMDRSMVVQVLYSLAGKPETSGHAAFSDVSKGAWYYDAVQWTSQNGVAAGTGNGKFEPTEKVTREQLAQFLYSYVSRPEASADLSKYPDQASVSSWATSSVKWAVQNGIISGSQEGNRIILNPQGNASRAEAAQMLCNFLDLIDGHQYEVTSETAATCDKDGSKVYTCSVCDKQKTETIKATGKHDYTSRVTKDATCTEKGVKTYTCRNCGDTYTEEINALGHEYMNKVTTPATCGKDGVRTYTCSRCGDTYTEAIPATGKHDYAKTTKDATCTEDGSVTYTCTVCGDSYTETIDKLGHDYQSKVTKEATCAEDGVTTYACSHCGDSYTEIIPATGKHDYEKTVTKEATCTDKGVATSVCKICGDTVIEGIDELGHFYLSNVTKEPTCGADGVTTHTCSRCGDSYTEAIPATGKHDYVKTVTKEPTCTDKGVVTYTCSVCGDSYVEDIDALGHNYQSEVTKEAACLEDGIKTYTCSRCNDSYTEDIDALGHNSIPYERQVWVKDDGEGTYDTTVPQYKKVFACTAGQLQEDCCGYITEAYTSETRETVSEQIAEHLFDVDAHSRFTTGYSYAPVKVTVTAFGEHGDSGHWETWVRGHKCTRCNKIIDY